MKLNQHCLRVLFLSAILGSFYYISSCDGAATTADEDPADPLTEAEANNEDSANSSSTSSSTATTGSSAGTSSIKNTGALIVNSSDNPLIDSYPQDLSVTTFSNDVLTTEDVSELPTAGSLSINYNTSLALTDYEVDSSYQLNDPGQCANSVTEWDARSAPNALKNESIYKEPSDNKRFADKIWEAKNRLQGKIECYSDDIAKNLDLILKNSLNQNLNGSGCYRPDWGVIKKNFGESDEICLVGFARNEIGSISAYVDFSTLLLQSMLCQSKRDEAVTAEPELDVTLDLNAQLTKALEGQNTGVSAKSADVTKKQDSDGSTYYRTNLSLSITGQGSSQNAVSFDLDFHLKHYPSAGAEEKSYNGVLWLEHGINGGDNVDQKRGLSVVYSYDIDDIGPRIAYELRKGDFNEKYEIFDDNGEVNFNTNADFSGSASNNDYGSFLLADLPNLQNPPLNNTDTGTNNPPNNGGGNDANKGAQSMNHIVYDGYPLINVGKLSYWVNFGGSYNENARGFVFDTHLSEDGIIKGCGIAGAAANSNGSSAYSIRKALKEGIDLSPKGYLKPFDCNDHEGSKVWQQCFKQDAEGKYVLDEDKMIDVEAGFDFVSLDNVDEKTSVIPQRVVFDGAETKSPLDNFLDFD